MNVTAGLILVGQARSGYRKLKEKHDKHRQVGDASLPELIGQSEWPSNPLLNTISKFLTLNVNSVEVVKNPRVILSHSQ